jgi:hypothetical protein
LIATDLRDFLRRPAPDCQAMPLTRPVRQS